MAIYGDETPWGTEVFVKGRDGEYVMGYEQKDGSTSTNVTAAILENAADILATKITTEPDSNVVHVVPGDDNAAKDARVLANRMRLGL